MIILTMDDFSQGECDAQSYQFVSQVFGSCFNESIFFTQSFHKILLLKTFFRLKKIILFLKKKNKTFLMRGIVAFLVVRLLFITTAGFCWQIIQLATVSESICPAGRTFTF